MDYRNRVYYYVGFGFLTNQQEEIKVLKKKLKTIKFHYPYGKYRHHNSFPKNVREFLQQKDLSIIFLHYMVSVDKKEKKTFENEMNEFISKYDCRYKEYQPYYLEINKDILGQ